MSKYKKAKRDFDKSYEELQEISKYRMIDILNNWYQGWSDMDTAILETQIFAEILVNGNPYLGVPAPRFDKAPSILVLDTPESGDRYELNAYYDSLTNSIVISKKFVTDFIKHEVSLSQFINTVAHEARHFVQTAALKALSDENSPYYDEHLREKAELSDESCQVLIDLKNNSALIDDKNMPAILSVIKTIVGESEFTKKFEGKTEKEKQEIAKEYAFATYVQSKHEEDARVSAIAFTRGMLQNLIAEPSFDKFIKREFAQELENGVAELENEEKRVREKNYKLFEQFDAELNKLTLEHLQQIEDVSEGLLYNYERNYHKTEFGDINPLFDEFKFDPSIGVLHEILEQTLKKVVLQTYKEKPLEKTLDDFLLSVSFGHILVADSLTKSIVDKMKFNNKKMQSFYRNLCDFYKIGNLTPNSFQVEALSLLGTEHYEDIFDTYLKQGKFEFIPLLLDGKVSFDFNYRKQKLLDAKLEIVRKKAIKKMGKMFNSYLGKKNLTEKEMFDAYELGCAVDMLYIITSDVNAKEKKEFSNKLNEFAKKVLPHKNEHWDEFKVKIYGQEYVDESKKNIHKESAAFWREQHEKDKKETAITKLG